MNSIFSPIKVGDYELANRVFMAPLTRARADAGGVPNELMAKYYEQRASAGLIIAEATAVNAQAHGWPGSPGIYNQAQVEGWKQVTKAVHDKGGRIFLQIWHMGRTVLPDYYNGEAPVSASPVKAHGTMRAPNGEKKPYETPREISVDEIMRVESDFVIAAKNAIKAGFDGVEIHGANNYLLDCFLRDGTNKRTDEYGGSATNRAKFLRETVHKVCSAIGAGRVGVRISPTNAPHGITDSDPHGTFTTVASMLEPFDLAYLHVLEGVSNTDPSKNVTPAIRKLYSGTLIINCGYTLDTANAAIEGGEGDAVAFGVPYISNPDLATRLERKIELSDADPETFYTPGPEGYVDYPSHQDT